MNAIKTLTILASVLFSIGLSSCNKQNPALEFVDIITDVTSQIENVQNIEEFEALDSQLKVGDKYVNDHADYVLTESDKDAISKALSDMIKASFAKQAEFNGGTEIPDEQIEMYTQSLTMFIQNANTLGELNNQNAEIEDETSEGIIEETPEDSVITEVVDSL